MIPFLALETSTFPPRITWPSDCLSPQFSRCLDEPNPQSVVLGPNKKNEWAAAGVPILSP